MANLVSMELSEQTDAYTSEPNPYGYGLTLCLCEEQLAALGISGLPDPGTVLKITALATVAETEVEKDEDGTEREMRLQITDMSIDAASGAPKAPGRSADEIASSLYS